MSINSKGIKGCDKLLVLFLLLIAAAMLVVSALCNMRYLKKR